MSLEVWVLVVASIFVEDHSKVHSHELECMYEFCDYHIMGIYNSEDECHSEYDRRWKYVNENWVTSHACEKNWVYVPQKVTQHKRRKG